MNFDDIFQEIGEFGWYQGIIIFLIFLPGLFLPMLDMGYVFLSAIPNYRCYVNGCDNSTTDYNEPFLNFTTPVDSSSGDFNQCQLFPFSNNNFTEDNSNQTCNSNNFDNLTTFKCNYWKYDDSVLKSSVVTEWNLVCDDSNLVALSQSIYMLGNMVGGMVFGLLADKYGRKTMLMLCMFITCVVGVVSAFVPNYTLFVTLRFFLGASSQGVYISILVMSVELVGKKQRGQSGMLMCVVYAIGEVVFGGLAYAIRDWQWLQLVISAPFALFMAYFWIIPESPRWSLLNGNIKAACKVLKKIAKSNKKEFPEYIMLDFQPEELKGDDLNENKPQEKISWLDLFRTSYMRMITINMCFNWFMITVSYYGITMSAPSLGGDQYINFIIVSSIEVPAYLFGMFAMDKIGRRFSMCFCMILGGVAGVCTSFVPTTSDYLWMAMTLATIGKFGAASAFGIIYVFTAELYPTGLRNNGIATSSFIGHIGGVVAPYLAALETVSTTLPLVIFGICSLVSGVLSLTLPETLGRQLPETIDDCKSNKICGCRLKDTSQGNKMSLQ